VFLHTHICAYIRMTHAYIYRAATRLFENSADKSAAWFALGTLHLRKGNLEDAAAAYQVMWSRINVLHACACMPACILMQM